MDEEVHGFASADRNVPPINQIVKRETPYPANGWQSGWALPQKNKNDISEKGMDEEVHGFASADRNVPPINQIVKRETPYPANGW